LTARRDGGTGRVKGDGFLGDRRSVGVSRVNPADALIRRIPRAWRPVVF
jgi:hypothetical protein